MAKSFGRGREDKHAVNRVTASPKYKLLHPVLHYTVHRMVPQNNTHTHSCTEFHSKPWAHFYQCRCRQWHKLTQDLGSFHRCWCRKAALQCHCKRIWAEACIWQDRHILLLFFSELPVTRRGLQRSWPVHFQEHD